MMTTPEHKKIEIISGKQKRLFSLILLLDSGLDRSGEGLAKVLNCSTPTFHRLLAELRSNYDMDVTYNQSLNRYEIASYGCIPDRIIRAIGTILAGESELSESLAPVPSQRYQDDDCTTLDSETLALIDGIGARNQTPKLSRMEVIAMAVRLLSATMEITGKGEQAKSDQ